MKTFLLLGLLLSALPTAANDFCRVVDGDTLVCGTERIRLKAICAAEKNEAGGPEASAKLTALIAAAQRLELVRHGTDRYERTLADLWLDGEQVTQQTIGPKAGRGLSYCK